MAEVEICRISTARWLAAPVHVMRPASISASANPPAPPRCMSTVRWTDNNTPRCVEGGSFELDSEETTLVSHGLSCKICYF